MGRGPWVPDEDATVCFYEEGKPAESQERHYVPAYWRLKVGEIKPILLFKVTLDEKKWTGVVTPRRQESYPTVSVMHRILMKDSQTRTAFEGLVDLAGDFPEAGEERSRDGESAEGLHEGPEQGEVPDSGPPEETDGEDRQARGKKPR